MIFKVANESGKLSRIYEYTEFKKKETEIQLARCVKSQVRFQKKNTDRETDTKRQKFTACKNARHGYALVKCSSTGSRQPTQWRKETQITEETEPGEAEQELNLTRVADQDVKWCQFSGKQLVSHKMKPK